MRARRVPAGQAQNTFEKLESSRAGRRGAFVRRKLLHDTEAAERFRSRLHQTHPFASKPARVSAIAPDNSACSCPRYNRSGAARHPSTGRARRQRPALPADRWPPRDRPCAAPDPLRQQVRALRARLDHARPPYGVRHVAVQPWVRGFVGPRYMTTSARSTVTSPSVTI